MLMCTSDVGPPGRLLPSASHFRRCAPRLARGASSTLRCWDRRVARKRMSSHSDLSRRSSSIIKTCRKNLSSPIVNSPIVHDASRHEREWISTALYL